MTVAAPPALDAASTSSSCCCEPLMPALPGEPMTAYFRRFAQAFQTPPLACLAKVDSMAADGIYIHKRPVRSASGTSPLAACGSVYHHVIIYIKEGDMVHLLDFGPANGADVTANIMEAAPGRQVLQRNLSMADVHAQQQADGPALPYLYCGPVLEPLDSPVVQKAISFIEGGHYHALWRNCIHAADLLLRALTRGQLRSGPMLYDVYAGEVPVVENPMVMMLQMMMQRSWMEVCDGSALASQAAELLGWASAGAAAAAVTEAQQQQQSGSTAQAAAAAAGQAQAAAALTALARAAMSAATVSAAQAQSENEQSVVAQSN